MRTLAAISQARLNPDELHQLKWLLGQCIALISLWALFGLEMGSEPLLVLFNIVVATTIVVPHLPGRIPSIVWKAVTPALIAIIVVDFAIHGVEFLKPMVRMVTLLTLVRSLQYRKSREDLQLVLLGLFTLVVKGVLTVSLLFAFQMMLFTPLAMAVLFLVNLLETSRNRILTPQDWNSFHWMRFLQRLNKGLDYRLLGFAGVLFVGLVSVSSLLFVLMPRFSMEQALPFLKLESSGKVGFSDRIRFGDVNELSQDDSEALRVSVPDINAVPTRPFWRMVVLDEYQGGVFEASRSLLQQTMDMEEGTSLGKRAYLNRSPSEDDWVFFLEGDTSCYLPLIGTYNAINFSQKTKFFAFPQTDVVKIDQVPASVFGYRVSGMTPTDRLPATRADVSVLDNADGPVPMPGYDEKRLDYPMTTLAVPSEPKDREYLESIVQDITGGTDIPPEEFAQRAQVWLQEHYSYDMKHKPLYEEYADPLILWMRESDRGWCEHFAGAFTLICRTEGIPTRVIAGFAGAYWNNYEDYLVINNSNAHAWVELYINGYWVRYDPTPPPEGGMLGGAALASTIGAISGWSAWVDSLRMVWYRRVVNFDQTDQHEMASGLKKASLSYYETFKADLHKRWLQFKNWLFGDWNREKTIEFFLWLSGICFVIVGLYYLWRMLREAAGRGGQWAQLIGGDPIRRQAGKLLKKIRPLWEEMRSINTKTFGSTSQSTQIQYTDFDTWREVLEGLQRIRFGPNEGRPEHSPIFRQAKRLIRRGPVKE